MAVIQVYFNGFNVAPITLGGVAVANGVPVQVESQPAVCQWGAAVHNFNYSAGTFSGTQRQPQTYRITEADDTSLRLTPNDRSKPEVKFRP